MINKINFVHDSMPYCEGYKEFLERKKLGKRYMWNWQYFFLSPLWLITHKMYGHLFILLFAYLTITSFLMNSFHSNNLYTPIVSGVYLSMHLFFSFASYNIYYLQLDNKFHKVKYDHAKCDKIAKPHPIYILIPLIFILPALTVFCFNLVYSLGK